MRRKLKFIFFYSVSVKSWNDPEVFPFNINVEFFSFYREKNSLLKINLIFTFSLLQKCKLILTSVASNANPVIGNVSLVLSQDEDGNSSLNFTLNSTVDVFKIMSTFTFKIPASSKDKEYQKEIHKSTINLCNIAKGNRGNFMVNMLMENFHKSSSFDFKCPYRAAEPLSLINLKITDSFIPNYLILDTLNFLIEMRTKVKITSSKILLHFFTLNFFGKIEKAWDRCG